ncbi:UPF0016-domain-containing protein [Pseudovirgaria hyperparasitica]|uniref:UPF0016-domain-containing protein n=1 Tax=Pseudovirgaria hyperparasitica TaxID=470096 RepID=A0A6A6WII8_9PEZI|nr:UPF0016-domain-containing protein [Pseudovirgaria hyperparasitica]KAF2760981.1 UPF0016-domain-containing protein [Pseudovirgaria hyperparasitica]
MRLQKYSSTLIFLIFPILVHSAAGDESSNALARDPDAQAPEAPLAMPTTVGKVKSKDEVGTKDAPVDGLDGKPHKGPFVETKLSQEVEDLKAEKPNASRPKGLVEEDGVMNDRNRPTPKPGTTGTEGGVTEKERDRKAKEESGEKTDKIPEKPKEASHSGKETSQDESQGNKGSEDADKIPKEKPLGAAGLEKPDDLPGKPHDIPMPSPPKLPTDSTSDTPISYPKYPVKNAEDDDSGVIQPFHSFILSLTMILFSEVGDKTFLVAALMAMRHDRMVVFSAAFSALIAMTVLSAVLGHAVPTLLPKRFTNFAAAILFLVFGAKMLMEGYKMSPDEGVGEEMREVEAELEEKESLARRNSRRASDLSPYALEAGRGRKSKSNSRLPAPARSPSTSPSRSPSPGRRNLAGMLNGVNNLFSLLLSPAWVQTFIMTFLGEWGDRSQIATIAMAAGQDYWWVTGGAISGHAVCTGVAVIGGRAIAGRVSMRVVTLGGAIAFLVFGVIYLAEAAYSD